MTAVRRAPLLRPLLLLLLACTLVARVSSVPGLDWADLDCVFTGREVATPMVPFMESSELALFRKYLVNSRVFFETGSGGSTYEAVVTANVMRIISIEGDSHWIQKMADNVAVRRALCDGRLSMYYVDIGASGEAWNRPQNRARQSSWPLYAGAIELLTSCAGCPKPDLVLVDGRFSVAVALHACRVVAPAAFVLIHDYRDVENRGHEKAESCLELVEVAGTLGVFRRRDSVAHHEVEGLLREHHNITW